MNYHKNDMIFLMLSERFMNLTLSFYFIKSKLFDSFIKDCHHFVLK